MRHANSFICLHQNDNVLVCIQPVRAGEVTLIDEKKITLNIDIQVGHKISRCDIGEGEKIIKSGAPIGSTLKKIPQGEHVHTHNMRSDYHFNHSRNTLTDTSNTQ